MVLKKSYGKIAAYSSEVSPSYASVPGGRLLRRPAGCCCCCCWRCAATVPVMTSRWDNGRPIHIRSLRRSINAMDWEAAIRPTDVYRLPMEARWENVYCIIIRQHCSNSQMRPIATDGVAWSVCVSVCRSRSWALQKRLNRSRCGFEG